ncbi:MAG: toll/interleukin-1 receptor domain-containing protein [Gemmatimonadetes bacterium]|nr:toll/interleukin-1 receptor domain-containing protein [Gemmatimonadota bacterium]
MSRIGLPDRDLDKLVALVADGRVVPIVGDGLLQVRTVDGDRPVAEVVAAAVAERIGVEFAGESLSDLGHTFLAGNRKATLDDFRDEVHDVVSGATWEPSDSLRALARIRGLRLLLTTGFDPLLATSLREVDGNAPLVGAFATNARHKDLPSGWQAERTVYHLYGQSDRVNRFAVTEEDVLETLLQLQAHEPMLPELTRALQQAHLLLLGCRYPDWLSRVFLRIARRKRLADGRQEAEYLAIEPSPGDATLVRFLEQFSTRTVVVPAPLSEVVEVLAERCSTHSAQPPTEAERPPSVFISYANEDRAMAEAIATALQVHGLDAWLDKGDHPERLHAGDDFRRRIRERIAGSELFVAVLSPRAAARPEGFYRREWEWALERASAIAPDVPFLVPVALDGLSYRNAGIPERMRTVHWITANSGGAMDVVAEEVKHAIRTVRARRARGAA